MSDRPSLLVLCGTRHRPAMARRMARSVIGYTSDCDWDLYVADAGDPGHDPFEHETHPNVHVVPEFPRLGMSAGLNRLFLYAGFDYRHRGVAFPEWVVWLNDDATVEPGWARNAIEDLVVRPLCGMAALSYLTPHAPAGWHVNYWPEPALPYANFGLLRTSLWQQLGGFDERVRFYGCDNAFSFRVLRAGKGILPVADARVVHHFAEDDTRTANVAWDTRAGWDEAKDEYMREVPAYRETQQRAVPRTPGFVNQHGALVVPDGETYQARYGRVAGQPESSESLAVG